MMECATPKARCEECIFSYIVNTVSKAKPPSREIVGSHLECHVARPTKFGFPSVRAGDFCSLHVNRDTGERTFQSFVHPPYNPL